MRQIIQNLIPSVPRDFDNSNVVCLFPRFLQLILDDMLTEQELESFSESETFEPPEIQSNSMTYLVNKANYVNALLFILTDFMTDCMFDMARPALPPQGLAPIAAVTPEAAESTEDVYVPEALEE